MWCVPELLRRQGTARKLDLSLHFQRHSNLPLRAKLLDKRQPESTDWQCGNCRDSSYEWPKLHHLSKRLLFVCLLCCFLTRLQVCDRLVPSAASAIPHEWYSKRTCSAPAPVEKSRAFGLLTHAAWRVAGGFCCACNSSTQTLLTFTRSSRLPDSLGHPFNTRFRPAQFPGGRFTFRLTFRTLERLRIL